MDESRSAGIRRTERLSAGEDTRGIVTRARQEIASTWRVYGRDWIPVWSDEVNEVVSGVFDRRYEGRVREEDWKIVLDLLTDRWVLWLRLWNVVGEWKNEALAEAHREELAREGVVEVEVVPRNGRREHVLTQYSRLKLPDAKTTAPRP